MLFIVKKPRNEINEIIMWLGENLGEDWKITKTPQQARNEDEFLWWTLSPMAGKTMYDTMRHLVVINHPALKSTAKTIATFKIPNDKALLFKLKWC